VTPTRPTTSKDNSNEKDQAKLAELRVCVRVRPLLEKEIKHVPTYARKSNSIVRTYAPHNTELVHIYDSDLIYDNVGVRDRQYTLNEVFPDTASNTEVFESTLKPLMPSVR
jgi:hypothetical protein